MSRLSPDARRQAIVDAALAVALRKGIATTTVRDVAVEMGTSSGLVHHYFDSMDDVLAAAFAQAAGSDLEKAQNRLRAAVGSRAKLMAFFDGYARSEDDQAFQLWLDAWAEATRRPALGATSKKLNVAWQQLLARTIRAGVADGSWTCTDPGATARRVLSMLDGLALQSVAHGNTIKRAKVVEWSIGLAQSELGLDIKLAG